MEIDDIKDAEIETDEKKIEIRPVETLDKVRVLELRTSGRYVPIRSSYIIYM